MSTPLVPLGDEALLATCPTEAAALRLAQSIRHASWPWLVDVVQAYKTVATFYDPEKISYAEAHAAILAWEEHPGPLSVEGSLFLIPCCYELGPDLSRVAQEKGLTTEQVIQRHSEVEYTVYAIGFCPGFPYLGYLPEALCGVPRLSSPRLNVPPGSVGLTGRQTGIYTEPRPGGWNLIGRTPRTLVDVADGYFPLRTGDRVRFIRIDEGEFARQLGQRLGEPRPHDPWTQGSQTREPAPT